MAYTCETAAHFWLLHVLSRWEKFLAQAQQKKTKECIKVCIEHPDLVCCSQFCTFLDFAALEKSNVG